MPNLDLIDPLLLQPFVACMKRRGAEVDRLLEKHRIPPELVVQGGGKVARRQAWKFLYEAEINEGFDTLGFLQGDPFHISELGAVGQAIQRAPTLKDAINTFCQLLPTIADGNTATLIPGEELSWLVVYARDFDRNMRAADHFTILPLRAIIRLAAGPQWRPEAMRLLTGPHPALQNLPDTADIRTSYDQDVVGVAFKSELLSRPLRYAEKPTRQPALSGSRQLSDAESVEVLVHSLIPYQPPPNANEMAEILGISRATLYRKLADEGVSYGQVLDRARLDYARQLLKDPSNRIKEIAFILGYSTPGNFVRAFTRMTGVSPGAYRNRHR